MLEDNHVRAGYILGILFVLLTQKYLILSYFISFHFLLSIFFDFIGIVLTNEIMKKSVTHKHTHTQGCLQSCPESKKPPVYLCVDTFCMKG